ncbi:hypothetical protein lerEdw1_014827 [Lerista edwardsae]|nr:hypothetical protein lerEdw1_014829 [Lerista edwardsae]KAJ6624279.1 hypothetical protein lerEdw1_014827 [Lerista edwardsae]
MTRAPGRGGASAGTGRPGRFGISSAEGAMAVPCALITSCAAEFPGEELVKRIIGTEELPQDVSEGAGVRMYPWTIDNKYYSADIHLCVVPNRFLVTAEIAESVQAFLVYFDSTTISGLDSISAWLPLVEEWLPEVMILVCDRVCENGVSRQKAQEWCIKHSFELVELSPEELPDEDDDFPESTGVKRIIQALNANVWSNVLMKNGALWVGFSLCISAALLCSRECLSGSLVAASLSLACLVASAQSGLFTGEFLPCPLSNPHVASIDPESADQNQGFGFLTALVGANHSIGSEENDASEQPNPLPVERVESTMRAGGGGGVVDADSLEANTVADPMLDMDIQELASLSAGEGDLENFGRLFSKLKEMKEKAATLPHEQRKLHAEKVTKAFWMAIGGDRDEIEGLSSDEDL